MASASSAIRMLGNLSRVADDVVEAGAKNLSEGNVIKATTTQLSSNMTNKQKQVVARIGREAAENARNTGRRAAEDVTNSRTANRAINRINNTPSAFDEMAATFDAGGGSRGRSGNRGYNNSGRRRVEARRVNANNASQNVVNHNTTQRSIDNVNANNRSTRRRNRNRSVNNTVNTAQGNTQAAPINVMSTDAYNQYMNQIGGPTYTPPTGGGPGPRRRRVGPGTSVWDGGRFRDLEYDATGRVNGVNDGYDFRVNQRQSPWSSNRVDSAADRVPIDYQGELGQIERSVGGRQGTAYFPDTVPMDFSGDMRAIEDMTGTKFNTKKIKGNAPRNNTNTNTNTNVPEMNPDNIINFDNRVPMDFEGDINQIERTMGGNFNTAEIQSPKFENTNYMNVNQQQQQPKFQDTSYLNANQQPNMNTNMNQQQSPFERQMNMLNNQQQTMQQNMGVDHGVNYKSSNTVGIDPNSIDLNNTRTYNIDDIKDVDAFNTMMNEDTRSPLDMKSAWSGIKGFSNEYLFGGIRDTYTGMAKEGLGFQQALSNAFTDPETGAIRWGRVAGTYATASAGARLLSGGGLTRDRNGNPNLIGVPFI